MNYYHDRFHRQFIKRGLSHLSLPEPHPTPTVQETNLRHGHKRQVSKNNETIKGQNQKIAARLIEVEMRQQPRYSSQPRCSMHGSESQKSLHSQKVNEENKRLVMRLI